MESELVVTTDPFLTGLKENKKNRKEKHLFTRLDCVE